MPRAFSDSERTRVRRRLLQVAQEHFARFGYRKANVAEIARDAGISKGAVYLFVTSKALLFAEVAQAAEAELRTRLVEELRGPFPSPYEKIRHFLRFQFQAFADYPVLSVMLNPEEAGALIRDLPEGALQDLREDDDRFFSELVEGWQREGILAAVDARQVAALPRAIFVMNLQRELIGEDVFPDVVELIIDSLCSTLIRGDGPES